ncbi:MAG: 50S ribosomal protein L19e, partial [Candidatus Woesearchaeota archaeon]
EIKEAITKSDIRGLINSNIIRAKPKHGISSFRSKKIRLQKRKGRRKGHGSRKGKKTARLSRKNAWINKIRAQRSYLKYLHDKKLISPSNYRLLYRKSKGGFFRSERHIKLYIDEHNLLNKQ